jgi:tetratricopeptide (TPR) repeat protein
VIGLVQVGMQGRADRYTYLPLVGATIALAWSVDRLAKSAPARRGAAAAGAAAVAALAVAAHAQAGVWRDTETLFRHAAAVDPDNWFAWQWVGSELLRQRDLDAAEEAFLRSLELRPQLAATQRGLADVHAERGDWNAAIRGYERAIRLRPREAVSHMRLARALAASGQTAEALGRARHAVTLAQGADRAQALVILAFVHLERGEIRPAIAACRRAAEAQPGLAEAHSLRGLALLRAGRVEEARSAMQHALALASARGDSALAAEIRQQLEGLSG